MHSIFSIENLFPHTFKERGGVDGNLDGLDRHGLFVAPSASVIARTLANDGAIRQVLIAHHPPREKQLQGDTLLPPIASARRDEVSEELKQDLSNSDFAAALQRLEGNKIEFVAKCLRQDPATAVLGSHLFDCLVQIVRARESEGDLAKALEALEKEFATDRGRLVLTWQRVTAKLCALDLDLNALEVLSRKDPGAGGSQAADYLTEMLREARAQDFVSLRQTLQQEMQEVTQLSPGNPVPDLGPILRLLDILAARAKDRPAGASGQDVAEFIALAAGPQGFSAALWHLSRYFSTLVQDNSAAAR